MIENLERKTKLDASTKDHLQDLKTQTYQSQQAGASIQDFAAQARNLTSSHVDYVPIAKNDEEVDPNTRQMGQSRRAFYKELKKVIDTADVVL